MAADFLQTWFNAAGAEPKLAPVNQATLASDCASVLQRAGSLQSYQTFLTAARAAKAKGKGAPLTLERTVQAQAAQAFADAEVGAAAALRVVQQVNQTSFWTDTMARMTAVLKTTGPVSAQQIWSDVWTNQTNAAVRAALQAQGLTDAVAGAVASGIAQTNASFVLQDGKLAIAGSAAGGTATLALRTPGTAPADVGELLRSAAFDQVVAAFTQESPLYLDAAPAAVAMEPAEIFAAGAIAARQHMADHVRGLQDVGLSTVTGADPVTAALVTLLVAGLVLGAIGALLLIQCTNAGPGGPPGGGETCAIGQILVMLAMLMLGVTIVASGGAIQVVAVLGLAALVPEVVAFLVQINGGGTGTITAQ
jgi:hypothetical protein